MATGSIDPGAQLGDWVDPSAGGHLTMPTSNTQTQQWVKDSQAAGIKSVDMEYAHIAKAFGAHTDARLTVSYVVSDVMVGPNRTDLTETRIGKIAGLAEQAAKIIARALGLDRVHAVTGENRSFPSR